MLNSTFVEDIFIEFYQTMYSDLMNDPSQDHSAASSFYKILADGKELTQNQANFLLKILKKYNHLSKLRGLDYEDLISTPMWKHPFRVIDLSKKIFVEKSDSGFMWVCAKFPYQLKKEFDSEIQGAVTDRHPGIWDPDRKLRKIPLYDSNLVQLYEFAKKHNFEIDDTFLIALGEIEEIWQNVDDLIPYSVVQGGEVWLVNASEDTEKYFDDHSSGNIFNDALLAKTMGYPLKVQSKDIKWNLVSSSENSFWIKDNQTLLSLYNEITGKICIVLDRTSDILGWLKQFVNDADKIGINRSEIKVCFRDSKDENTGVNDWVKENNVGGSVEDGRILIFKYKPAKWLFKDQNQVKMLVTNNLYPSTNNIMRDWLDSHPAVIYLSDIRPSEAKDRKIVNL